MKGDVLCVRFLTFGVNIYNICFFCVVLVRRRTYDERV